MKKVINKLIKFFYPFVVFGILLSFFLVIGPTIKGQMARIFDLEETNSLLETISLLIHILLIFIVYLIIPKEQKSRLSIGMISFKDILVLLFIAMAIFMIKENVIAYSYSKDYPSKFVTMSEFVREKVEGLEFVKFTNAGNLLDTILLMPVIEEMYFRYYMNLPYNSKWGYFYGFIISTILFTFLHGFKIASIVRISIGSLAFFIVFFISKNVMNSIVLHIFMNLIPSVMFYISTKLAIIKDFGSTEESMKYAFQLPNTINLVIMSLGFLGLIIFVKNHLIKK